jgi:ABC-type transporter Mla subunit MlaD
MKIPSNEFSYPPVGFRGRRLQIWAYLFILSALAILGLTFYQIAKRQHLFDRHITFYSYLDHSQGIQVGDPVFLMGFKIGYVYKLDVGSNEPGHERQLVLIYKVQRAYHYYINTDSTLEIQRFIPGTSKLELTQGKIDSATGMPQPEHPTDQPVEVVLGTTLGGVADKFAAVLDKIQNPEGSIGKLLDTSEVHDQVVTLLDSMSDTLDASTSLISHLDRDLTGEQGPLKQTLQEISQSLKSAREFIEGLKTHWLFRSAFRKKDPNAYKPNTTTKGSFTARPIDPAPLSAASPSPPPPASVSPPKQDKTPLVTHPSKGRDR